MKVGVIGCGYWGANIIRNFLQNRAIRGVTVADIDARRAKALQAKFPAIEIASSVDEILVAPSIDLVAVITPVSAHFELAREALRQGKHVLVEKPLCRHAAAARELVRLARDRSRILAVDHTFVYTPVVQKIRTFLDEEGIGSPWHFDSVRVNLGPFRHDINVLWDLAAHDLSVLFHITRQRPMSISAQGLALTNSGTEDLAYLHLQYADGSMANIRVSWCAPAKVRQVTLTGPDRMLLWDDLNPEARLRVYEKGGEARSSSIGATNALSQFQAGRFWVPSLASTEPLSSLVSSLVRAVRGEAAIPVSGQEGLEVVEALEAAERSIRAGGQRVELTNWPPSLAGHKLVGQFVEPTEVASKSES